MGERERSVPAVEVWRASGEPDVKAQRRRLIYVFKDEIRTQQWQKDLQAAKKCVNARAGKTLQVQGKRVNRVQEIKKLKRYYVYNSSCPSSSSSSSSSGAPPAPAPAPPPTFFMIGSTTSFKSFTRDSISSASASSASLSNQS